jgi:hypothetical protein
MTNNNHIGAADNPSYPIHRIQEAHDRWREVYEGLQLIQSCIEQGRPVPLDRPFGGMVGREWQPRLAELPTRLRANFSGRVAPAIRACCRHPGAPHQLRDFEKSAVAQIEGVTTDAVQATAVIGRVCTHRPTRRTQLSALNAALGLLAGLLMVLDDVLVVAKT